MKNYIPVEVYPLVESTGWMKLTGELPVAAQINTKILGEPWFKHYEPEIIDKYVEAVLKVVEYHEELLAVNDTQKVSGGIGLSPSR